MNLWHTSLEIYKVVFLYCTSLRNLENGCDPSDTFESVTPWEPRSVMPFRLLIAQCCVIRAAVFIQTSVFWTQLAWSKCRIFKDSFIICSCYKVTVRLEDQLKCWIGKDVGGVDLCHMKTQLFICLHGLKTKSTYINVENVAGDDTPWLLFWESAGVSSWSEKKCYEKLRKCFLSENMRQTV